MTNKTRLIDILRVLPCGDVVEFEEVVDGITYSLGEMDADYATSLAVRKGIEEFVVDEILADESRRIGADHNDPLVLRIVVKGLSEVM